MQYGFRSRHMQRCHEESWHGTLSRTSHVNHSHGQTRTYVFQSSEAHVNAPSARRPAAARTRTPAGDSRTRVPAYADPTILPSQILHATEPIGFASIQRLAARATN